MSLPKLDADYRQFRFRKLNTPEFRHLRLLLYWPVFGLLFFFVERIYPVEEYHVMHCFLDDLIPFNELFLFPYLFWFIYLVGMHVFTLLFDVSGFRRMMAFVILTYTTTILIYLVFPTCQELRPTEFARDNALTAFIQAFYAFDTNTNVCPSLHVTGSLAVMFAAWHSKAIPDRGWRLAFTVVAVLISISTVFLKQHSVLDVLAALPICLVAYRLCYLSPAPAERRRRVPAEGN